jgi:hypothetical protein
MRRPLTSPGRVLVIVRSHETGPTATLTIRRHGGAVIGHDSAGRETVRTMCEGPGFNGPTGDQLAALADAARRLGYGVKLR